jgi:hypothetical protein
MTALRDAPERGIHKEGPGVIWAYQRGQLWRRTRAGIGKDITPPSPGINRLRHGGVMTFEDRFWAKVSPRPNIGDGLWNGSR